MRYLFLLLILAVSATAATRYYAKDATLTPQGEQAPVIVDNYVQMKDGNLSFSVQVTSQGTYDILIRYKQNYADNNGTKIQNLVVNNNTVGSPAFLWTNSWKDYNTTISLNAGANTIAITKNWGWVDINYIEIDSHESQPFDLSPNPVNPNANDATKKMFAFIQENFQEKIISGVMTDVLLNNNVAIALNELKEVKSIRTSSNKTPALVGFDFMHGTGKKSDENWFKAYTSATISLAKDLYQRGGIPAFCWHWKDPLQKVEAFYTKDTDFDLTKACTNASCTIWKEDSDEYKAIVKDIDIVADYLKKLQTDGVAVLWRPIHEPSGGWFWWGAKGAGPFKSLYKLIFNRLTNHHGLNNLIWVWNSEGGGDADWYPGENYVDIIGRDYYYDPRVANHASLIAEFETLKNTFGNSKMLALAEIGSVPYPQNLINDGAGWSYFMVWNDNDGYVTQDNSIDDWNTIMNHEYVITLEDMPGWENYTPPSSSSSGQGDGSSSSNSVVPILSQNYQQENVVVMKYYNLQGQTLGTVKPQKPGVYIVKNTKTGQAQRVLVR